MDNQKYDLTFPQKNIWLADRFDQDTTINNITGMLTIKEGFNAKYCEVAINTVIKANDAMRLRIRLLEDKPVQWVEPYQYENIAVVKMSQYSTRQKKEYLDGVSLRPLILLEHALYDFKILDYGDGSGSILLKIHHIIADAWAGSKIATQLSQCYEAQLNEQNIEITEPSYLEFVEKEKEYVQSEKWEKDKTFWKEYLHGIEETLEIKTSPNKLSTSAKRYTVNLDKKQNRKINQYCKRNKISPYVLFLTALSVYLYRIKEKEDFVIGTPVLNRSNFKEKQMIGMFVSTLPLRIQIQEGETFIALATKIARNTMTLFRHQKYPYSKILEEVHQTTEIKNNLYHVILSYQNARTEYDHHSIYTTDWMFSKHLRDSLQIHLMDIDDTGCLQIHYDYLVDLFEQEEIEYIHTRLMTILEDAMEDSEIDIEHINIMGRVEKHRILNEFNNTRIPYHSERSIIKMFETQVTRCGYQTALIFGKQEITYHELNKAANRLARFLVEKKQVKRNDVVGVVLNRSLEMMIAILGVLKAGAAYLPIDPNFPEERITYMLENSKAKEVITAKTVDMEGIKIEDILIDSSIAEENLNTYNEPEDAFYILYTSGSTGKPKGVVVKNKNMTNLAYHFRHHEVYNHIKTVVSITTISFDIFAYESIISLLHGLKLVIANEEEQRIPKLLDQLIIKHKIDMMQTTPTRCKLLLDNIEDISHFKNLKSLVLAGEQVTLDLKNKITSMGDIKVFNGYGPTETTIFSSFTNITNESNISIGMPLSNTKFYILDKKMRLLPIGIEGELYIGGDGVAKGYLQNEALTKEAFLEYRNRLVYKSGDICKIGFDNKAYCFGRVDNQVKINGIRIELDEIVSVINSFPGIIDAAVVLYKGDNVKELVTYYTQNKLVDIELLKKYVRERLPKYMVPALYIPLDKMPLTPNSKIDKKVLTKRKIEWKDRQTEYTLPQTALQEKIKEIIVSILQIDQVGVTDNLYEYGLDSLNLIQLAINLSRKLNIELKIKDIYDCSTIVQIETVIKERLNINEERFSIPEKQDRYPLTDSQKGLFNTYSLDPDSIVYNIPFELKLSRNIDIDRLKEAIIKTVKSHPTLLTCFEVEDGKIYQRIDEKLNVNIKVRRVAEKNYPIKKRSFVEPFDLLTGPLFKIRIYVTKENTYVLFDIHHIIFDGSSIYLLVDDIKANYEGKITKKDELCFGQVALLESKVKHSQKYEEARNYFLDRFQGELPNNSIPLDKPRSKNRSFKGEMFTITMDRALTAKLNTFSRKYNVTLNNIFLSMYNFVLAKYMYHEDVIIGMAVDTRSIKEEENSLGMYINTIPYRTQIQYQKSVLEYLQENQNIIFESIHNSLYTYADLVKDLKLTRDSSRNPLFDVMFVYQNRGLPEPSIEGMNLKIDRLQNNISKFELTCEVLPNFDVIDVNLEYCTDLFNRENIERFGKHYINAIEYMIEYPDHQLKDIKITTHKEENEILNVFNAKKTVYNRNKTVLECFEENVMKYPNKPAIVSEGNYLTYHRLNERANQIAHYLVKQGIKPNDVVGVMIDKSIDYMVAIIAIGKCGGIYVSLNRDLPDERVKYMLENANAKMILTTRTFFRDIFDDISVVHIDEDVNIFHKEGKTNLDMKRTADDIVHIIYTSGSTGLPKGNMIINRGIMRLVLNTNYVNWTSDDVMMNTGSLTFDTSTFEIWGAMIYGMTLHMLPKEKILNPAIYKEYILENHITTSLVPTPIFNQMADYDPSMFKNAKSIYVGGDVMLSKYANAVFKNCPNLQLYDVYGPAENTVICTAHPIKHQYEKEDVISIGGVVSNNVCYVVDKCDHLCPVNVPGDLYVGGDGLGLGYVNRKELTEEKFTYIQCVPEKIYKTGDLTLWKKDGTIKYMGRIDSQIKIRGQRVEILEIQNKILEIEGIKEAVVTVQTGINDSKYLIAYYTQNSIIELDYIEKYLRKYLPAYMVPYRLVAIEKMPLNQNGKIAMNKLPKVELTETAEIVLPQNLEEERILNIFKKVLDNPNIGMDSDFFENGGDSLLVVKLISEFSLNGLNLTYSDAFKYKTPKEIYHLLFTKEEKHSISDGIEKLDYRKIDDIIVHNKLEKPLEEVKVKSYLGNVLLTGVTGFLGVHVLESLIKNGVEKVYCLVRKKNNANVEERIKKQLEYFFESENLQEIKRKLVIVEGDITNRYIFVNDEEYERTVDNITTVINCAACVKHFGNFEKFMAINVKGTENLIRFCEKNNKELIQISTLSVSGNLIEGGQIIQKGVESDAVFDETKMYIGQNLDNVYVYTKFLAEKAVLDKVAEGKIKAKIIRVGNLTGRYRDGKFQPNVNENAFSNRVKTMVELKMMPENMLDLYLEMTPIDYTADAIVNITRIEEAYTIFHVFNNKHAMMPFVMEIFSKLGIDLTITTIEQMKDIIEENMKDPDKIKSIEGILADINEEGVLEYNTNIQVKSDFTNKLLSLFNFKWPEVTEHYFIMYLEYLKEIGFLNY